MTETNQRATDAQHKGGLSRRQFIAGIGGLGIGAVLGSGITALLLPDDVYAIEASQGYLLVDAKKCAGCETCVISCSLAHLGRINTSLSRIQVMKNALGSFPSDDVMQNQCRQCPLPFLRGSLPRGRHARRPRDGRAPRGRGQVHRLRALRGGVPLHAVARAVELRGQARPEVRPVQEHALLG